MPKVLTSQQIDQYHELGFISPIEVMSAENAAACLAKLESAERNYPQEINPENRNNAHLSFKFLDEIVHHSVVLDVVEDLIGPNISLWGSVLFIKEPHSKGYVSWHQDATYVGIKPHDFVTPWLALTPSNRDNGCMSMIPGSHKDHIRTHDDTFAEDNILTRGQVVPDVDESSAVDLILEPGQMSVHHSEIVHGSQPNNSAQRRVGFAMQAYMPPHVRQVIGKNYWLDIRGNNQRENSISLDRPRYDMDRKGAANRKLANDNWAEILYQGAEQKRAY
ncbi:MAG: phytanoyl-CoA dioxygenase family protein [bacterium]